MSSNQYQRLINDDDDDDEDVVVEEDVETLLSLNTFQHVIALFVLVIIPIILIATRYDQAALPVIQSMQEIIAKSEKIERKWSGIEKFYFTDDEIKELNCTGLLEGSDDAINDYVNKGRLRLTNKKLLELPMDCESVKFRVYGDIKQFNDLERPIAYVRNIYRFYELQEAFLSIGYHPSNIYCYSIDSKSDLKLKNSMRTMSYCFENVFVMDKEYDLNSGGHGQDKAHFDCLSHILNRKWDHVLILQNFDLIIKTNEQMSNLSKILNTTSIMGWEYGYKHTHNSSADWTPRALKLFKNESAVPGHIIHKNMTVRKGLNEVFVSRTFVNSLFEKLNLEPILKRFDDNKMYGVDEMLIQTLYENYLGLDGQYESNCTKFFADPLTRLSDWNFNSRSGYTKKCRSKWKRHDICVLGVEYLKELSETVSLIANKVVATFDFGTVICARKMIRTGNTGKSADAKFLRYFPQFREMEAKLNGTFDRNTFRC